MKFLNHFSDLFATRPRRYTRGEDRVLIELRDVAVDALPQLSESLKTRAAELPQIEWVELQPYLRRAVFALDPQRDAEVDADVLRSLVEQAERECEAGGPRLPEGRELPDDELLYLQRWVELLADVGGLSFGLLLRLVPFAPALLGANAVFALSLVQSQPRLRRRLDERLGKERADLILNLSLAFGQGLSQRPMASVVDVSQRVSTLRELHARRRVFASRRPDLMRQRPAPDLSRAVAPVRPRQAPPGPLESYADRAWIPAMGAFGVSLLSSRSLSRATAALFAAIPKPAHYGRTIFTREVGRTLAKQGTLVLDPAVLERLDRIDCMVVDGRLLTESRFSVGKVIALGGVAQADAAQRVRALFDPSHPLAPQDADGDRLGPPLLLGLALADDALVQYRDLAAQGALVLVLARRGVPCALAEVQIRKGLGIEDLLLTAEQGGLRVLIATNDDELTHLGFDYETIPAGARLPEGIARLQSAGRTVCYVSDGPSPALAQADCGVGIHRPGEVPPFGAHVLCGTALEDLRTLLRASLLSRSVSKQGVKLAIGAAAVGTLISSSGRGRSSRQVMFVVNVATLVSMINALRHSSPLQPDPTHVLPDPIPWHALETASVLARLGSSQDGLTRQRALERKLETGADPTAIRELGRAVSEELLNPLSPLLAAGAGLSAIVGSTLDAGVVAGVGGLNALVGGVQRFRAERALRTLVHPHDQHVRVYRDATLRRERATDLVPGDVIELSAGELVPADCRLLDVRDLEVDSSSLTGESMPTLKHIAPSFAPAIADRGCMLYAGTEIASGDARAVVVAVGSLVEAQRSARFSNARADNSGVEARLRDLMQLTGPIAAAGGLAVVVAGLLRGHRAQELVVSGVSMAVAAIPEGLPVLASAAQLSVAQRLSSRGVVVRNARSIEALGRVDVICLDKTGTLTEGLIELHRVATYARELGVAALDDEAREVVRTALRASSGRHAGGEHRNPTDAALFRAATQLGVTSLLDFHPRAEHAFESARGYHAVVGRGERGGLACVKGAPELVVAQCRYVMRDGTRAALGAQDRADLLAKAGRLASLGLRVLAVAERQGQDDELDVRNLADLTFRGMLAFRDPPRHAAAATIAKLRGAGIEVVMLTGDHLNTASRIARDVDLLNGRRAITGGELARMDDAELAACVSSAGVFARVTPAQKVRIVRALQSGGRAVAMVGDGANDAPALRAAEVGVALGRRSTQAARAAADIVFTDAGIDTLFDAAIEARAMWVSVRDAVSILVGGNLGEIGFCVLGGFVSGRPPLNPRQILVVNFLTDVAPAMAVALRRPSAETYAALAVGRPADVFESGLNRDIAIRAISTSLGASWAWGAGRLTGTRARASTMALVALVATQLGQTLLERGSDNRVTWTSLGSFLLLGTIVQTPGVSHLFGCRPMGPFGWSMALTSSAAATLSSVAIARVEERVRAWIDDFGADQPDEYLEVRDVTKPRDAALGVRALPKLVRSGLPN